MQLQNKKFQKEFLSTIIEEFGKDGDVRAFFRSLELVIRARGKVASFCRKVGG